MKMYANIEEVKYTPGEITKHITIQTSLMPFLEQILELNIEKIPKRSRSQ